MNDSVEYMKSIMLDLFDMFMESPLYKEKEKEHVRLGTIEMYSDSVGSTFFLLRKNNGPEIRMFDNRLILQMTLDDGWRDVNPAGVILEAIDELETAIEKENEK